MAVKGNWSEGGPREKMVCMSTIGSKAGKGTEEKSSVELDKLGLYLCLLRVGYSLWMDQLFWLW